MRVMRKAAVGLLLIFVNLNLGLAWDEPKGFRDVPRGAAASDVQSGIKGVKCPGKGEGRTLELCFGEIWIAPVRAIASAWIGAKGFEGIDMSFPSSAFPQMEVMFTERYGVPTERKQVPIQNQMGAQFTNEILIWQGEMSAVRLERYGVSLDIGLAMVETRERQAKRQQELLEKVQKGKRDL
jgi:hypothetical protein